jgi:hypothetical protein
MLSPVGQTKTFLHHHHDRLFRSECVVLRLVTQKYGRSFMRKIQRLAFASAASNGRSLTVSSFVRLQCINAAACVHQTSRSLVTVTFLLLCCTLLLSLHALNIPAESIITNSLQKHEEHHHEQQLLSSSRQYIRYNKRGRVVMRNIDKIVAKDLRDITDDAILNRAATATATTFTTTSNETHSQSESISKLSVSSNDREPILQILREAGITQGIDQATTLMLPNWEDIINLYYSYSESLQSESSSSTMRKETSSVAVIPKLPEPIVLGKCDLSIAANTINKRMLATAGLFNSGTNALTYYLRANLVMPGYTGNDNRSIHGGILTQVPWDKHWFNSLRYNHPLPGCRRLRRRTFCQ